MSIVRIVGLILIILALMSLLASYDQYESGKRAERIMQMNVDTGIYGSSYNQIAKEYIKLINTSGAITFFGLVTSFMTGLIGICFISMDKSIEQLKRKAD